MTDREPRYDPGWDDAPGDESVAGRLRAGRGLPSPGVIFLAIAVIGSIVYMAFVIQVRDSSQIPMMASGAG